MINSPSMDLSMDIHLAEGYKSPSQRARRITEGWFAGNMYCPACPAERVVQRPDNTRVVDFVCDSCGAEFQLKAKSGPLGRRLRDAAYGPMMQRILSGRCPHFAFLNYDSAGWMVRNLLLVPGHFFTPGVIEKCRPLSARARRATWVGCNVMMDQLPEDARITVIRAGTVLDAPTIRRLWGEFAWMENMSVESRGWLADVLRCVRTFGCRTFALAEMYAFEGELARLHPGNRNVRPKIRQQLQLLRDRGALRFVQRGVYQSL